MHLNQQVIKFGSCCLNAITMTTMKALLRSGKTHRGQKPVSMLYVVLLMWKSRPC